MEDKRTTWWLWRHVRQRLVKWTLALLQGRRYTVILSDTGTGCEDPDARIIQTNPQLFKDEPVTAQFRITQGLLAHEVGHALFTGEWPEQQQDVLCHTVNLLEDERIERAICAYYPGVAQAIHLLGDLVYANSSALTLPPAYQALACCLAWRWAHSRMSEAEMFDRLGVSSGGQTLWSKVKPLVEQAWTAPDTSWVIQLARDILRILSIAEDSGVIELLKLPLPISTNGIPIKRSEHHPALPFPSDAAPLAPGLGRGVDNDECPNVKGDRYTSPVPYVELEDKARPLARRLYEALQEPQPDVRPMPHEWRGRYSFRQEARTPDTPHLSPQAIDHARRSLALMLLVDRSGSMSDNEEQVRLAMMTVYLAATDLGIPIGAKFFGGDMDCAEDCLRPLEVAPLSPQASEPAKALVAGFHGETCEEFLAWALQEAEKELAQRPERLRIALVIHDGEPVYCGRRGNDRELSTKRLQQMERAGITPIGVYLGEDQQCIGKLHQLFGKNLIVTTGDQLPDKLSNVLLSLA